MFGGTTGVVLGGGAPRGQHEPLEDLESFPGGLSKGLLLPLHSPSLPLRTCSLPGTVGTLDNETTGGNPKSIPDNPRICFRMKALHSFADFSVSVLL